MHAQPQRVLVACRNRNLDPSAALLWLMAVATVVVASLWAGSDFMQEVKSAGRVADDEVTPPTWLLIHQKQFLQKWLPLFAQFLAALVLACLGYLAMFWLPVSASGCSSFPGKGWHQLAGSPQRA